MRKIVYVEKDDASAIAICRDNHNGVAVQVIRFVDQLVPSGQTGNLVNHRANQTIFTKMVPIQKGTPLRHEVELAVKEARDFLSGIRVQDDEIEGLINNYYSQNKDLNTDV